MTITLTKLALQSHPAKFAQEFENRIKEKQSLQVAKVKEEATKDFARLSEDPEDAQIDESYEDQDGGWIDLTEEEEALTEEEIVERKIVIKVDAKGKKKKKIVCKKGFKLKNGSCVPQKGSEKLSRKKGLKKAVRKKKANVGGQKQALRKRAKALKKRKGLGL